MQGTRTVTAAAVALSVAVGAALGFGFFTFLYAKGGSYLTNDPAACANCHVMREHFSGWMKSSHRHVAVCNDCHTPSHLLAKYAVKGTNGFSHSFAFTSGEFHDPIRIRQNSRKVAEAQCRRCHGAIVDAMDGGHPDSRKLDCLHCHSRIGHP